MLVRKHAAGLVPFALLLMLSACGGEAREERIAALREKYVAMAYSAAAEVSVSDEAEELRYTLRFDADGEETRVTVLAPELLAGITARVAGETLALEYDGLVLNAGGTAGGVSAVNCVPLALRAVGEGWLVEENEEKIEHDGESVDALRLCFETERGGETLRCIVWFGADDAPLRAQIAENEKITADMEFTSFAFCDTITA